MVKMLEDLYEGTKMGVWTKNGVTEYFNTGVGLKQGCVLSPLAFSMFVNDLPECLGGGVKIGDIIVKCLMYADDIAIIADSPQSLQGMINDVEQYCQMWGLTLNRDKSQIMIFGKGGGRPAKNEKWCYMGQPITVAKEYKYLGIIMTPSLNLGAHFRKKVIDAKHGLGALWGTLIGKRRVPLEVKHRVFDATTRAVVCYGAQVWGYRREEQLERLQRFYLKKLLALPQNTPNYALYSESGFEPLYFYTLKLQIGYVNKILKYPQHRLPRKIAEMVKLEKITWFEEYGRMARDCGVSLEETDWIGVMKGVVERVKDNWRVELEREVQNSAHHQLFGKLDRQNDGGRKYMGLNDLHKIRVIARARTEMLTVNYRWWRDGIANKCSMCNLNVSETSFHFLAACPVLREFRVVCLGKPSLTESEIIQILNGNCNTENLVKYIREAGKYRQFLISEYNYE